MKTFAKVLIGVGVLGVASPRSHEAMDVPQKQVVIEAKIIELDWARVNSLGLNFGDNDLAWAAYWRNRAGALASEVVMAQLSQGPEAAAEAGPPEVSRTTAPADPNAAFRAAPTPEENLARVPAVKLVTQSDYVPKPREGEPVGITVDYARLEALIRRYAQEPTSTVPVIPPIPGPGWGGWSSPAGVPPFALGGYGIPPFFGSPYLPPPCVLRPPIWFSPGHCGGISGGLFYHGKHFSLGLGFGF